MLRIQLFGSFQITDDEKPVPRLQSDRVQALVAYLVLHRDQSQARQQLAVTFWPDTTDAQARTNLRTLLARLREALPDADQSLVVDAQTVQWRGDAPAAIDLIEFEQALVANRLTEAITFYHGDLLPTCYDDWITGERERLRQAYQLALEQLLQQAEQQHRFDQAIAYAQRLLRHDPLHETTYRHLMRLHALNGDRVSLRRVYDTCTLVLKRELDVEPSLTTRDLYSHLLGLETRPTPIESRPQLSRHNLRHPLTSLIGRERELAWVKELLLTTRLLTLTGAGGSGKTRLAIEAATGLVDYFADGVWLIEFAPLNDAALVPHAVASTLGLLETGGRPLVTALIDVLREKQRLLIFDNCEHLIDACAQLVSALLHACPQLHILSTSRERLDIPGETPFRVPPLSTPDTQQVPMIQELARYEAVRLFIERGGTAIPAYTLTADNATAIARICQRLDGMPLAIELAAARLKTLRAEEIAARLNDRFQLLTGGSRTALPRQQTLRATIEWSYNLLSAAEQVLLQRLSVFAGGWTLEAAECIATDVFVVIDPRIDHDDVMDMLTHLTDKSLIDVDRAQGQNTRYHMLETIRQYAREVLIDSGEEAILQQRHLDYYVQLAERAEPELIGPDQFAWFDRLETEFDNIRTALDWSLTMNLESGLRLASALRRFWMISNHQNECCEYLSRLLQLSTTHPVSLVIRAKALAVLSKLLIGSNELGRAQQLVTESLELCHTTGDVPGETLALLRLAEVFNYLGRASESCQLIERCLALSRAHDDPIRAAEALNVLAFNLPHGPRRIELLEEAQSILRMQGDWVGLCSILGRLVQEEFRQGDYTRARRWLDEMMDLTRRYNSLAGMWTFEIFISGSLALRQGDYAKARIDLEESTRLAHDTGQKILALWALSDLGYVALHQGDSPRAHQIWRKSLDEFREANYPIGIVFNIEGLAGLAVQCGQLARAARLLAWADGTREAIRDNRPAVEQADVDRDLATIHAQLDEATYQVEQEAGRTMTMTEAIAYALKEVVN
jgi:predicted ATPase/DNA-binding SARP family transcriptional activator